MKLKFPKKIKVGNTTFEIRIKKDQSFGCFNYSPKPYIEIGTQGANGRILEIIIHELKEIIQIEQGTRYESINSEKEYLFCGNHSQHTDLCARLSGLLEEFIV